MDRSEISGNHTDHEGGHVIAGSLDVAVDGIAVATDSNKIRVADEGYPTFEITLDTLDIQKSEKGTSASLVRGMAHEIAALGVEPHGFDFAFTCSVPSGGGLSSSAAVEAAYGRAMETLWGAPAIEPVTLAQMSQRTENNYYGKPCGLMDQAAVCLGGLAYMDFEDQAQPKTQKLELNFEDHGYALVLVKVGADHVAATDDYAAVPREMQDVAAEFGKARLCEVNVADFDAKLPELRAKLGDRACLRAVHYWYENGLVDKRWAALNAGDIDQFLVLTRESGASSAMYLQNVVAKLGAEQPSMYALALAEHVLDGRGAVRIHGGGFGGTMTSIGIVIGFGCIMGIFLEKSGAAKRMAITILKLVGVKRADVVLGLTGFVVSIPVFCDSGFVILSSLAKEFSRLTKKSMVGLGGILGMGLYITHFMVPPTPGPLAVVSTFQNEGINIDLGMFIIAGLLFSIPLFVFSVFLFRWFGNKYPQFVVPYEIDRSKYTEAQLKVLDKIDAKIKAGKELENEDFTELLSTEKLPSAGLSFTILLLPVFLILANTLVSQTAFKATIVGEIITFLGNPVIALFISLCLGAFLLAKDLDNKTVVGMMNDALRDAGPIVMITAGGGALGAVVKATGAAGMMANGIVAIGIPGILVPLLIGTIMRFPQGSGTTAMITGSAIIAPMLVTLGINPYLAGLAVCLTAMCPSFLNDSYFHVVTSFSGMDIKTSLKTWTIGSILVPIFGSVIICILSLFIH